MACQHFQAQKVQERTRQELLARKKRGELQEEVSLYTMDQITTKTPKPICRLYWCLLEFIDWRYCTVSHVGILDPSCELVPL
jgi:hypothetical protein